MRLRAAVLCLSVGLLTACGDPAEYKNFKTYLKSVGGDPSDYSRDTVEFFADANCGHIANGGRPGFKVTDSAYRYFAATAAAYCPAALRPFIDNWGRDAQEAAADVWSHDWARQ